MRYVYLLLCLICFNAFGQVNYFQIELVNENVGASLAEPPSFYTNESNDAGLNQIFQTHNVSHYETVYGYSINSMIAKNGIVFCDCNPEEFIQDVMGYTEVINFAALMDANLWSGGHFYNGLGLILVNSEVGDFQSLNNGIILTNNGELNQIFSDFGVRVYETLFNSDTNYELVCDCDAQLLKNELDDLTSVVSYTNVIPYAFLLSNEETQLEKTEVYPNPFKNKVTLKINADIDTIEVYDILGKRVLKTKDKVVFESKVVTLKSGVYILKLRGLDGSTETKKLVKQ